MHQTTLNKVKGFTILESFIILGILFVLSMLIIALYLHHFSETPASESAIRGISTVTKVC
jgi:competence protein ComGC